jgi:hypoxanthine phosphoribosyltransferase
MKTYNFIDKIVIKKEELEERFRSLSFEIQQYYNQYYYAHIKEQPLVIITVLEGASLFSHKIFNTELFSPNFSYMLYYISASSYFNEYNSSGEVKIDFGGEDKKKEIGENINGKSVLIVDDIYETGLTLSSVQKEIESFSPSDIQHCVMINRIGNHQVNIETRFVGFPINMAEFFVGAGLDYKGKYRNLPYIATLKKGFNEEPKEIFLCNGCGCPFENGMHNAIVKGGYYSEILEDCTAYRFDLCERCLEKLFNAFSIPVEKLQVSAWTDEIIE